MSYWSKVEPGAGNLRLFEPESGWHQYNDEEDKDGRVTFAGAKHQINLALSSALSASNLLLLTGAGSSLSATNPAGGMRAPLMPDLWDAVEAAATKSAMEEVINLIPAAARLERKNIEKLLSLCKLYATLFDDQNSRKVAAFIKVAEKAIVQRVSFVGPETDISAHRMLLRKVARRGSRKPRAKIFTTNYDKCFEHAAQQQQFVAIDGFSHSIPQIYDRAHFSYDIVRREVGSDAPDYIESVFHLYKLHGSLDWRRKGPTIIRSSETDNGEPVLIYPRDSKYQEAFEAPYLDMMGALHASLREPDTALVVSGFGFNDDHISKPILAALEANMSLRVILCDVAFLDDKSLMAEPHPLIIDLAAPMRVANPYFVQLRKLIALGDTRIVLLNGRFQDLAYALPDLVAQTERERHTERVLKLRQLSHDKGDKA